MSKFEIEYSDQALNVRHVESGKVVHIPLAEIVTAVGDAVTNCFITASNFDVPSRFDPSWNNPVNYIKALTERDAQMTQHANAAGEIVSAIIQLSVQEVI